MEGDQGAATSNSGTMMTNNNINNNNSSSNNSNGATSSSSTSTTITSTANSSANVSANGGASSSTTSSSSSGPGRHTLPQISVYSSIPDRQTVQVNMWLNGSLHRTTPHRGVPQSVGYHTITHCTRRLASPYTRHKADRQMIHVNLAEWTIPPNSTTLCAVPHHSRPRHTTPLASRHARHTADRQRRRFSSVHVWLNTLLQTATRCTFTRCAIPYRNTPYQIRSCEADNPRNYVAKHTALDTDLSAKKL